MRANKDIIMDYGSSLRKRVMDDTEKEEIPPETPRKQRPQSPTITDALISSAKATAASRSQTFTTSVPKATGPPTKGKATEKGEAAKGKAKGKGKGASGS